MLLNWAVRAGRLPIFADLDVAQNEISLPGNVSALVVERTALVDEGFNVDSQIDYHFGYKSPAENPHLYRRLITILNDIIGLRCDYIQASLVSGVIINTSGWIKDEGYASIVHAAKEFEVSTVLVIDQERLRVELKRDLPDYIKVMSLPKSGGVVSKSQDMRSHKKDLRIHEYFYGTPQKQLFPHSFEVRFDEVKIFKIGMPSLPDDLLPMGMKSEDNYTKVYEIAPSKSNFFLTYYFFQ
jgi:polyribonucleotide 5'-hydroxyl-kinase